MYQAQAIIIDDDAATALMFEESLQMARYQVQVVYTGSQALSLLETATAPHLIMLDVNLPEFDGQQIYQAIRKNAKFVKTRVIIATANSYMAGILKAELREGDVLMIKPIDLVRLQRLALETSRARMS